MEALFEITFEQFPALVSYGRGPSFKNNEFVLLLVFVSILCVLLLEGVSHNVSETGCVVHSKNQKLILQCSEILHNFTVSRFNHLVLWMEEIPSAATKSPLHSKPLD